MTSMYKEYEVKIKMVQDQSVHIKKRLLLDYYEICYLVWDELNFAEQGE